jgi:hypothetical protein
MNGGSPTQGNGLARALLGAMGVILVAGGIVITYFIVRAAPYAFLAASVGLAMIGYGMTLLFACAFYDEVEFRPGPLGIPVVTRRRLASNPGCIQTKDRPTQGNDDDGSSGGT